MRRLVRRSVRVLGRGLAVISLVPALYLLAATAGSLLPGGGSHAPGGDVTIGLVRGPIHYDFLLPARPDTRRAFAPAAGVPVSHPGAEWILVGWGARDFYTTTGTYLDLSPRAIWRGITGDSAVLRIDALGPLPDTAPGLHWIRLTEAGYTRLLRGLSAELAPATPLDHPGFTATDRFFAVPGRFHLFRTCNVWVGEQIRAAGLPFGLWTPTPHAVTLSLRRFGWLGSRPATDPVR